MAFETHTRRPLFDRLVDAEPWEHHDLGSAGGRTVERTLDKRGVLESIRRELMRLFGTRSPRLFSELEELDRVRTVLDYGIPEVAQLSPARPEDRERLAEVLRRTVEAYEPRLRHVTVDVERIPEQPQALAIRIGGELRVESVWEPVWFPVLMSRDAVQFLDR